MTRPEKLGRYEVVGDIGAGAMGVVYDGRDPTLGRRVAIKTIRLSHLDDPKIAEDYQARFEREAHAVALLQHPHIVTVYDYGKQDDIAYLVMEYIQGRELRDFLERGERFPVDQSTRIMRELLEALDFAHKKGVVHRDIKPANIMLDAMGNVKLTDFGVARIQGGQEGTRGTMVGTLKYMSPEQVLGQTVDGRADIFAAGVVLYQFLTGHKPFDGGTDYNIQNKIVKEEPPLPSVLRPELHADWDKVCRRALAKNREARYRTARDFIVDLDRMAMGQPIVDNDATMVGSTWTAPDVPHNSPIALSGTMPGRSKTGSWNAMPAGGTTINGATADMELEFWRAIKDSTDPEDYELYLAKFPQGLYVDIAAKRSRKLRGLSTGTMPGIPGAPGQSSNAESRINFNDPLAQTNAHPHSKSYVAAPVTYSAAEMAQPDPEPASDAPMIGGVIEPVIQSGMPSAMNVVVEPAASPQNAIPHKTALAEHAGLMGQIKAEVAALDKKKDLTEDPPALVKLAQANEREANAKTNMPAKRGKAVTIPEPSNPGLAVAKNPREAANGKAKSGAAKSNPTTQGKSVFPLVLIGLVSVAVAGGLFMFQRSQKTPVPDTAASPVMAASAVSAVAASDVVASSAVPSDANVTNASAVGAVGVSSVVTQSPTSTPEVASAVLPSSAVFGFDPTSAVKRPIRQTKRAASTVPGVNPDDLRLQNEARRIEEQRKSEAARRAEEYRKSEELRKETARKQEETRRKEQERKRPDPGEKILN